ncbi:bifunctional hydroxymethylpyrimidine kinase/phosphomethylpyrimidine kinase [Limnohabitans sp. T6-5]|uniref:bifunctional hydroxymethylpyrimidine kinase/phosphomethylpyrimidine kinase n=1 Tax=Limnohabitans sp. T6-5 TaxID=1100724 RepID=UPI000D336EBF|nr:bifunctional hydroxymethylpyrimidine kinase/phosphomethylpyrimidine kinase [Limnohabitans sp. T6-5]PUE10883.1 bifunctional hydroxymethylpyrimidine kinase/phosphomethylpyrimidine kinase [Limnohabitans sp. T6-5]
MPPMNPSYRYARVLTIAGSDSGGGAGIQADLKTFAALGCYGMSAITALTAQNTVGVQGIHAVPAEFLKAQIQSVVDDIGVDAIKIGMLHAPGIVEVVAWAIDHYHLTNVVLDPVMVATSGDRLIANDTVQVLVRELFPRVRVITPNLDEAALLLGRDIPTAEALATAGQDLLAMGAKAVLLKGGHLAGDEVVDLLVQADGPSQRLASKRIPSRNVHGTGCTLSSAIAAHLALGHPLGEAVSLARTFILGAIAQGAGVTTGHGHGPLNHGFAPVPLHRITKPPSTVNTRGAVPAP